jgi:hypothetical protein
MEKLNLWEIKKIVMLKWLAAKDKITNVEIFFSSFWS